MITSRPSTEGYNDRFPMSLSLASTEHERVKWQRPSELRCGRGSLRAVQPRRSTPVLPRSCARVTPAQVPRLPDERHAARWLLAEASSVMACVTVGGDVELPRGPGGWSPRAPFVRPEDQASVSVARSEELTSGAWLIRP